MEAETTNDPTNMAELYVASYRFMQAVSSKRPPKAVAPAKAIKIKNNKGGHGVWDAFNTVRASLRKFCKPVTEPPDTPQANRCKVPLLLLFDAVEFREIHRATSSIQTARPNK